MLTVRTSPVYVNQVRESWDQGGGISAVVPSNDPFAQLGPTLDLVFAGVPTDPLGAATQTDYTINFMFIPQVYEIAGQYVVWE